MDAGCNINVKDQLYLYILKNQFSTKRPCQSRIAKLVNTVIAVAIQHPYASKGMNE